MRTKHFKNQDDLITALYHEISVKITLSIREFGDARILLSGGGTPKLLYKKLSAAPIDWSKVIIGLVDERDVPLESEFSNERMLHEVFISSINEGLTILSMADNNKTIASLEKAYEPFFERIDYCLLGMGEDGHTASLFTNDKASEASLRSSEKNVIFTSAPSVPVRRISCSHGLITSSMSIGLMIMGEKKLSVLNDAEENSLPIGYFTRMCQQLTTYYSQL